MVKKSANWMIQADDRILEYLNREGSSSAWQIAHDVELRYRLVRGRLRVLARADWVAHHDRGQLDDHWSLTTWGCRYLTGDLDANAIRPIPNLRPSYAKRPEWWLKAD